MGKVKIAILSTAILILMVILIFFVVSSSQITGQATLNHYSYTKAICDDSNYCEDYEIACKGNDLVSFTPTGAAIQLDNDWKDPRDKELIERLC